MSCQPFSLCVNLKRSFICDDALYELSKIYKLNIFVCFNSNGIKGEDLVQLKLYLNPSPVTYAPVSSTFVGSVCDSLFIGAVLGLCFLVAFYDKFYAL